MRFLVRTACILALLLGVALAARAIVNSSTFQPFGRYVASFETEEKVLALTFDDGPHPDHTLRVLDILDEHGVKATFFMMGRNIERFPSVASEALRRGHELGNHSYSHPVMVFKSPRFVEEEIMRTDQLLRNLGVEGGIHFRPPHFSKLVVLPLVLREMGKLSVLADVDPEEWRRRPAEEMAAFVLGRAGPGSIIVMHDTAGEETLEMLEIVLAEMKRRGYRFETITGLLALTSPR